LSLFHFLTVYHCFPFKKYTGTSKFPFRILDPKVHFRVHKSPPRVHIASQMNFVYIFILCLSKIHFNIVLISMLMSPHVVSCLKLYRLHVENFENAMFSPWGLLAPTKPQSRGPPLFGLVTAYSLYSHLSSPSWGNLLHPQPDNVPCRGNKGLFYNRSKRLSFWLQ
jgi:hypothetical protein